MSAESAPALPWERARSVARKAAGSPLPAVHRPLAEALGHALAEPLTALTDLPAFDTAAMDGWAVAGPGPWQLLAGHVLAGARPRPLAPGTAVPIATGAQVPPGASAVLRREHGEAANGLLRPGPQAAVPPGRDLRPRGQECRTGEPLLPAGATVTPAVLGLAAAAGYDRLAVHRRPTVELLLLGDELMTAGVPGDGRVRDALGPLLPPWLRHCGAEVTAVHRVPDDPDALVTALDARTADVLLTTGSTAAGPADHLHRALAALGARLLVDSVAVRPGHPMLLAELPPTAADRARHPSRARHLVGLPGNPLAAVAGTATLAVPLLRRLGGHPDGTAGRTVPAASALAGHPRSTRLLPVRLTDAGAAPVAFDGPAMLRGLALADGLAAVPPGGLPAGAPTEVLPAPC
ncbi:molybdopterin molybdotransferase MoeA [Kitasatospora brasiliensis]|uniref:molybdopterin molybdotransferase MoeA n=1 Tax=Kitasatospora brasiliensis TaxID=3058040 RepID=UPI002931DEF0|nr:molybdopterin molybdotransferase MoeA [Kitasatospora sp. K002]